MSKLDPSFDSGSTRKNKILQWHYDCILAKPMLILWEIELTPLPLAMHGCPVSILLDSMPEFLTILGLACDFDCCLWVQAGFFCFGGVVGVWEKNVSNLIVI